MEMSEAMGLVGIIISLLAALAANQAAEQSEKNNNKQSLYAQYRDCRAAFVDLRNYLFFTALELKKAGSLSQAGFLAIEEDINRYNDDLDELERYIRQKYVIPSKADSMLWKANKTNDRITQLVNELYRFNQ